VPASANPNPTPTDDDGSASPATPAGTPAPRKPRSPWSPRYWYRRILALRATPHQIAMGAAVGVFIAFTPTFGAQMLLAAIAAFLFRLSKPATIIPVWVSNPLTFVPIYGATYAAGALLWPGETLADIPAELRLIASQDSFADQWRAFWELGLILFGPLWIGSVVVGVPCALVAYPFVKRGVVAYRHHRAHTRHERRLRRQKKRQAKSPAPSKPSMTPSI
jgi:uncharacterized protein (DUF2062 family)